MYCGVQADYRPTNHDKPSNGLSMNCAKPATATAQNVPERAGDGYFDEKIGLCMMPGGPIGIT
jgi:hypothetical protein